MINIILCKLIKNKEANNASWIIIGQLMKMILAFVINIITTRYLGPENYGLINYVAAYTALLSSFCTLGINAIIIKNFHDYPEEEGITLGTTIILRIISSFISALMIIAFISIVDKGERITILISIIYCIYLFFEGFDSISRWFQNRYLSKVTTIISLFAYIATAIYKIILLVTGKNVLWFAFSMSVDYIVIAVLLTLVYYMKGGRKLQFSKSKAIQLLSSSYHYILSGMMVAIYGHVDRFMIKHMLGSSYVGYYSAAFTICTTWIFILSAIIQSVYPTIISLHDKNYVQYENKNKQLYCIIVYFSITVSLIFLIFGGYIIRFLYGENYLLSIAPLKAITWYTAFSQLGVARNAWIVSEGKQKYLKFMYFSAIIINIILNYYLINIIGVTGAAIASVITQILTTMIIPFMIKEMRPNVKLMLHAILFKF